MKIIAVVSTLDLGFRLGCTPAWWQILKALYENDNEVVAIPYLGRAIETIWWRTYPNPWRMPGELYFSLMGKAFPKAGGKKTRLREGLARTLTNVATLPVWRRYLKRVLEQEKDVDALVFFNVPLNQITGIPTEMKREFGIRTAFYDGDMPTILPEHANERGFMFDYYQGARLDEYDVFLVNSEGSIRSLQEMGATSVKPLHYAADPGVFQPMDVETEWDFAFFGYGSQRREKWMTKMIADPSEKMKGSFAVGGTGFSIDLGKAQILGDIPMSRFRRFCCSSKINLNITRETHTSVHASSTARPFELAAMGCCIVSCPYDGLEKWFRPGREVVILSEDDDLLGLYESLLGDDSRRRKMGAAARERVLRDHTYQARAEEMTQYIQHS